MNRIKRNERGSALLIALIFLAVFSLWLTATLTSTQSSLHISQTKRVEPGHLYGADGAVEQAIQTVRFDPAKGVEGDTTCGTTASLNGRTYYVQCQPQSGSGKSAVGGSSPPLGILALSTGQGGEVGYRQRKNGTVRVDGGMFSRWGVDFQNGSTCPGTNCQQLNLCPNNEKTVGDAVFVGSGQNNNSPTKTVTSFSANWVNETGTPADTDGDGSNETDVGVPIRGSGIPSGSTISNVVTAANVTISASTTVVGLNRSVAFRENYPALNSQCHPSASAHGDARVVGMDCPRDRITAGSFHCNVSALDPVNPTDPLYPPDATTFTPQSVYGSGAGQATAITISGTMEGNNLGSNAIHAGDWIAGGYHLQGQAGTPYTFANAKVTIPVSCTDGDTVAGNIVVPLAPGPWTPTSTGWYPWLAGTNPSNEPVVPFEGSVQAPDLCNGNAMYDTSTGATFTADLSSTGSTSGVSIQFHYRDPNAKGKGNHNCADSHDSGSMQADVCGASVSSTYASSPTACPTSKIVTFSPGRYTDAAGLSSLINSCDGKLFYFQPGTYDFDFTGQSTPILQMNNGNSTVVAGNATWDSRGVFTASMSKGSTTITTPTSTFSAADVGKYVNSGTALAFGTKITAVADSTHATLSTGPDSKITNGNFTIGTQDSMCDKRSTVDHPGTEFIFSGPSQLQVSGSRFEICSPVSGNRQQIAIYGVETPSGQLVAQNGCVSATPYPGTGCAFIDVDGVMIVHGTVYAPRGAVDMTNKQVNFQVVSRGIIARTIDLEVFPNAQFTDPIIYSPDYGTVVGADREMLFIACPDKPCTSGGVPALRAMVRVVDHDNDNNISPGYKAKVESWTILTH
ncbi:MAG TPA: hypothetical protein VHD87_04765 [Acidimicrobiales bacterium]|nr:hypothetical protein [Acidimicrobiales bacterium]